MRIAASRSEWDFFSHIGLVRKIGNGHHSINCLSNLAKNCCVSGYMVQKLRVGSEKFFFYFEKVFEHVINFGRYKLHLIGDAIFLFCEKA